MNDDALMTYLLHLKLSYFQEHHLSLAKEAVEKNWTPLDFLSRLAEGESLRRKDRATQRRLAEARFPIIKTLEQFKWAWEKLIWPQPWLMKAASADIRPSTPRPLISSILWRRRKRPTASNPN